MGSRLLLLSALVLLLVGCGDSPCATCAQSACRPVAESPFGLWSEFLGPEEVATHLPQLSTHGIALYQNIPSTEVGTPRTGALLQRASCLGLGVRAWLTLPEADGYWPNERNAEQFAAEALRLARWIRDSSWPIDWIVVDMEPDLQTMTLLIEMLGAGDLAGALEILFGNLDPDAYADAWRVFSALLDALHAMGFRVMVVTFPLVLDDLGDDDATVQDILNTPVQGLPWDEVSFMVYTTTFAQFLGRHITPYLVQTYGADAARVYGERAALDLGVIAHGGMVEAEGITEVEELRAQVGAARHAGVERIHAYSLDGIAGLVDRAPWYDAFEAPAQVVEEQAEVVAFRRALALLDAIF